MGFFMIFKENSFFQENEMENCKCLLSVFIVEIFMYNKNKNYEKRNF